MRKIESRIFFLSRLIYLISYICLICFPLSARESAGTGGAAFLVIPVAVRSMGMGDSGVALPSGVNSAHLNPAGLTRSRKAETSFSYQDTLADSSLGFAGITKPLAFRGISDLGGATLFGSLVYFNKGTIEVNRLNSDGTLAASESKSAGYDLALSVGYAENFFKGSFGVKALGQGVHSLGVAIKGIQSNLAGTYDAQAASLDIGYMGSFKNFGLGLSVANLGSKMKFLEVADPLPVVFRGGVAVSHPFYFMRLALALDVLHQEEDIKERLGAEISLPSGIAFRGGWRLEPNRFQGGPSIGFGFDWDYLFLDYAFNWFGDLRDVHRLLLGFRFGSTLR